MHRLEVLGPPRLTRPDGSPADLALGKPFAVLVFLALTDTPPTRKELARLFWPNSEARNARQSVRQTLSILRRAVDADLFSDDDPVKLTPGAIATDVDQLREALEEDDVETAQALWRGRFMQDFALPDAPEWTRWVETREMALESGLVQLLATEAEVLRQRGEVDEAIRRLEKAIEIDPYREGLHSLLVDLHLDSGRLMRAAHSIGRARELLGPDTPAVGDMAGRMERRVRRREASENGDARAKAAELRTELVGRTREMAALLNAWAQAERGDPRVTVLTGPAGIGKTRLTEELAEVVRGESATVVRLTAERNERGLEWGLIAELARKLARLPGADGLDPSVGATLRRLSPAIPVSPEPASGALEPTPVAGSVTELLHRVAAETPLLLVVDEAQWADDCSQAVLSRLARSLDNARCALVICFQDEETDEGGRDFIEALAHAGGGERIRLVALSEGDVREMIALMVDLPEQNATTFLNRLATAAEGNPLYLTELLRSLVEEGTLVEGPEGLRLSGERMPDPLPLPSSVHELLHRRLATLSDPAIAFAAHLARLGGKARLEEVVQHSGVPEGALARAAGELLSLKVVNWSDPEVVSFAHERLRGAVLRDFPVAANGNGRRRWSAWQLAVAALGAVTVLAALLAYSGLGRRANEADRPATPGDSAEPNVEAEPYGGGLLLVYPADSVMWEIDPAAGPPEDWRMRPTSMWHPKLTSAVGPFRLASGDTVWYGRGYTLSGPPNVMEFRKDSEPRKILDMEGDVNPPSVSPDGRFMVFTAQNVSSEAYAEDLWISQTDGSAATQILSYPGKVLLPRWSPGGRYILTGVAGAADTILVLNPGGERQASVHVDRLASPAWCGATDTVVNIVQRGAERSILVLDAGTAEATFHPMDGLLFTGLACSPDASAVVHDRAIDGIPRRVLYEFDTERVRIMPESGYPGKVRWLLESGPAVPVRLSLEDSPQDIPWGESRQMAQTITYSDSTNGREAPSWTSSMPSVASVSTDGLVSANLPGTSWIRASLDGWLIDSVEVSVGPGSPPRLLLHDRFETVDTDRWYPVGYPPARAVDLEDGPALSLEGDGIYKDGLVSRTSFDLRRGITLEVEFRLYPDRDHHQQLMVGLASADPLPGNGSNYPAGWTRGTAVGFSYPGDEELRFDPSVMRVGFGSAEQELVRLGGVLPSADWVHVALQVRPDGILQLLVNRKQVAVSRLRLSLDPLELFRIVLNGAAVDTDLHVRNLRLWQGVRY